MEQGRTSESPERGEEQARFRPILGSLSAVGVSIGGIIGSGIFFIIGLATAEAGPAIILSLVLAGVIASFTALSFASLGSKIQKEGGEYQFVYMAFGPQVGFLGGILWIFSTAIAAVTVSLAFAGYVSALLPPFADNVRVIASASCLGFVLVDTVGLRLSSSVNNMLVVVKVGVLLFFIVVGIPFVHLGNLHPFFTTGSQGVVSSLFLIFFAYAGFGKITAASEEVKDAYRNVPRAIITAVATCSILYVLTGLVAVGVVGSDALSSLQFRNAPLAYVMLSTGVPQAFLLVAIGAIAATSSVLLIQVLGLSRTVYAMSVNRQLPRFLSALHRRFNTPHRAEVLIGVGMALGALVVNLESVVALTSLGILSYYAMINLAAIRLRKESGGVSRGYIIPILGFTSSAALVAYFLVTSVV